MTERRLAQIAWLARLALAAVFVWHGLAPKILWLSPDEVAMIGAHGLPDHALFAPELIARIGGVAEVLLGIALLTIRRRRWPLLVTARRSPARRIARAPPLNGLPTIGEFRLRRTTTRSSFSRIRSRGPRTACRSRR